MSIRWKAWTFFCRLQLTSTSIIKRTVSPTYLILIVSPTFSSLIPTNNGKGFGICFFRILSLASSATGAFESALSPYYTWSDHALPVTDIHCGCGGMRGHVITSSLDQTCKVKLLIAKCIAILLEKYSGKLQQCTWGKRKQRRLHFSLVAFHIVHCMPLYNETLELPHTSN